MRGAPVRGDWPDAGVTFDVQRGSFVIPRDLLEADDLAPMVAFYARHMPENAKPARRTRLASGDVRVSWRRIRVVGR